MPATLVSLVRGVLPLLLIMLAAAPAYAAGPTNTDPPAAADTSEVVTSGVELEYSADGSVVETAWVEETDAATAAAFAYPTRCKRVSVTRRKTNGVWTLWSYYQRQGFCHNGSRVNSLYDYLRRNNGTGPGWEFKGHVSKWSAGGAGKWSYTVGTQGHYAACTVVSGCIVHDYPWLQLKVLGNGSWTKTSGTG
ncbi:MAG: hypothetical protein ACRDPP_03595 [Gaiellaceae bacterium]